jgi:hypothetical protein
MMVGLKRISTALGVLAMSASASLGQGVASNPNQITADTVASSLRSSKSLAGHRIEIEARDGVVTLSGVLGNQAQKAEALARVQQVPGVALISDNLRLAGDAGVQPVQYQPQVAMGGHFGHHGGGAVYDAAASQPITMTGPAVGNDGSPLPEGPSGSIGATQAAMPGYPNYAWPSYAPYPNFSAVGYPTVYPWQAWPNIGPVYPYPEVPLDWRAVTLRWDDGIWWLDFKKHYTRPFFTPYPFGIFAY